MSHFDVTVNSLTCIGSPCGSGGVGGGDNVTVNGNVMTDVNLIDTATIAWTRDTVPSPDTAAAAIVTNSVGNTQLRQGVATSVVGRSANSTGNLADIAASTDGQVLTRASSALAWAFVNAVTIDVDPAGAGAWPGMTAALAACPAGGCILQLRCNATYTIAAKGSWGGATAALTIPVDNIWVRGCGASTLVTDTDNITTAPSAIHQLINIGAGIDNTMLTDFKLVLNDTCTSGCGGLNSNALIFIASSASYVVIERMQIYSTEAVTTDNANAAFRLVYTSADTSFDPDKIPRRVFVMHNDMQASNRAIEFQYCDHCWARDNYINFLGKGDDSTTPGTMFGIIKYEGAGVQIVGNIIKMGLDGYTNIPFMSGVTLSADNGCSTTPCINLGALVQGNTFDGFRSQNMVGVDVAGYYGSTIEGNFFSAGQCSASATTSCYVDEDCGVGNTCNPSTGIGIAFTPDAVDNNARNRANIVTGNVFRQWIDDTGTNCPISLPAIPSGTDPTENSDNIISHNEFWLSTTTDDGFCGAVAQRAKNSISCNHVVGSNVNDCGPNTVEATVDFGATGSFDATATITGQVWVTATSHVTCSPTMMSTADRPDGSDDALLDQLTVAAYARVAGTGFTVKAHAPNRAFGRFVVQCTGS
jgi:hypothetical protein